MFLFPSMCKFVFSAQLGAQGVFRVARDLRLEISALLSVGDGLVVAGLPTLQPIVEDTDPPGQQQGQGKHYDGNQAIDRTHAATAGKTSYWAIFRPRITAISLLA